jgi:very-short-patch-repair endonuclease
VASEIRAAGLARVIAACFDRAKTAVLVILADDLSAEAESVVVAACEWLADHAGMGLWLTGRPLALVDRVMPVPAPVDPATARLADAQNAVGPADSPNRRLAAGSHAATGRPHPSSLPEQALEAALTRCEWATGRRWNQVLSSHVLDSPVRVDLIWQPERIVVEIDGPEHRGAAHYAADRRRDAHLTLQGYAVLRFTNGQVQHDLEFIVSQIERLVRGRRLGGPKEQRDAG